MANTTAYSNDHQLHRSQGSALFRESVYVLIPVAIGAVIYAITSGYIVDGNDSIKLFAVGLVGLLGLFAISRNNTVALIALVAIVYLNVSNILILKYGLPSINKPLIPVMLVLMVYWCYRSKIHLPAIPSAIAIGLIYFSFVSSSLFYTDFPELTKIQLSKVSKDIIIMVITTGILLSKRDLKAVVWTLVACAALLSALSIANTITGDLNQDYFGLATWDIDQNHHGTINEARIGGNVYSPNYFAQILLLAAPMAVNRVVFESQTLVRIGAAICALLILGGVLATQSRSGLIILMAMMVVNIFIVVKSISARVLLFVVSVIMVVLLVMFAPEDITERVNTIFLAIQQIFSGADIEDSAIKGRLHEMLAAVYMFLDHPIMGVGFSTYSGYFQDYALTYDMTVRVGARDAHCLYLEIAAEGGVIGLLVFFFVVGLSMTLCLQSYRHARSINDNELAGLLLSLFIGYLAYLAAFVFLHDAWQRYFWLLTGIMIATQNIRWHSSVTSPRQNGVNSASPRSNIATIRAPNKTSASVSQRL